MNISQCKPPKHTHKEQPPVEKRYSTGLQNTQEFYMLARCCYLQVKITEDALLIQVQTSYWMVRRRRAYRSATTKCLFPVEEDVRNAYAGYSSNNTQTVIFISYTTFILVGWMLSSPPTPARSKSQWSPWVSDQTKLPTRMHTLCQNTAQVLPRALLHAQTLNVITHVPNSFVGNLLGAEKVPTAFNRLHLLVLSI